VCAALAGAALPGGRQRNLTAQSLIVQLANCDLCDQRERKIGSFIGKAANASQKSAKSAHFYEI
jgi:hypothetical protein